MATWSVSGVRTIKQIQAQIWAAVLASATLAAALTSTSQVAVWWTWTWLVATAQQTQEGLWAAFQNVMIGLLAAQKMHTVQWYNTMALAFQYGDSLPDGSDTYSPVRVAGDPAFVVTFANTVELANLLRVKVATGVPGALAPLSGGQLTALGVYIGRIKDAGVRVQCTSGAGDNLQTGGTIYYDPLVLNASGQRIDGTDNTPVQDAMNAFLAAIPFNGVFDFNDFINALQPVNGVGGVPGVVVADISVCQANYGAVPYTNIIAATPQEYNADAGYLVLDMTYLGVNLVFMVYV